MRGIKLFVSGAFMALLAASPASAAQLLYTVTGNITALVNGSSYTGSFVATGTSIDTVDANPAPTINAYRLASFTLSLGSTVYTSAYETFFFTNTAAGFSGFVQYVPNTNPPVVENILSFLNTSSPTYSGSTPFGPASVIGLSSPPFTSTAGSVALTGPFSNVTFKVSEIAAAVPEPATWALMIIGFGFVGVAQRRQRMRVRYA